MKQFQLFFYLIISVLLFSCKREKAIWESDWQAPLIYDSLTLNQLVQDSFLIVNGSTYELSLNRTIFELKLSDLVELPDTTVEHSYAINVSSFNVMPGTSFVNDAQEHVIELGDVELKKIRVKEGGIDIEVLNPIATKTFFTVQIPGATKNGLLLSQNFIAPPGTQSNPSSVRGFVDLSGYELDLRGSDMGSFNRLQSKLQVTTDPAGPSVVVGNQDSMRFNFTMKGIRLDYARGYLGNQIVSDTVISTFEAMNTIQSGMIDLDAASLGLTIENGFKVSAKLNLSSLQNTNNQGTTVSLTHPSIGSSFTINAATGNEQNLTPSTTQLLFDGNNSNLENYLENRGADNSVGFSLQLNPWGNVSGGFDELFDAHPLKVNLTGSLPLNIGLADLLLVDTFAFSLNQNTNQTHVKSGMIWLKATNAFPLQGKVTLALLDQNNGLISTIESSGVVASSVYGNTVNGIQQMFSYIQFEMNEETMNQINNIKKCMVKLVLNTPDAATNTSSKVSIPINAFFSFKLGAKLKIENQL